MNPPSPLPGYPGGYLPEWLIRRGALSASMGT